MIPVGEARAAHVEFDAGLVTEAGTVAVSGFNDGGTSFAVIADLIERRLLGTDPTR